MNETSEPKKIQRFVQPQWLREVSVEEVDGNIYHKYEVPEPAPKEQLQLVQSEPVVHHDSRAADETALIQAQINAKRKDQPLKYVSDKKDSIGHTAFLQHQIDLRRKK